MTSNTLHSLILESKYKYEDLKISLQVEMDWLADNKDNRDEIMEEHIAYTKKHIFNLINHLSVLEVLIERLELELEKEKGGK